MVTSIATTQANPETGEEEDDDGCEPGTEGCPCSSGGACYGELVCASQTCVDLGGSDGADEGDTEKPDPTEDPTDPSGDPTDPSGDTGGGPPGSCEGNCGDSSPMPHLDGKCSCGPSCAGAGECCPDYEDVCTGGDSGDESECLFGDNCESDEICTMDLECGPAWSRPYSICVAGWADYSPTCWDFDDCYADVYFDVYYGGDLVFSSPTQNESVMASWDECATVVINSDNGLTSNEVLSVLFYDEDGAGADDLMNYACHVDAGACSFIPVQYLHDGFAFYEHDANYLFDVTLLFNPAG